MIIFVKKHLIEIFFFLSILVFSTWLMFSTFSYKDGFMLIAQKPWGDFASHIPLIRSFSYGANFPPEYPIFPNEPIRYHFLFYFLVGMLEKLGLRIDLALNIPSILSFFFLLTMIYLLSKLIFKNRNIAIVSVLLFLFNSSLSFVYFFQKNPISFPKSLFDIVKNNTFPAFSPYDSSLISGGFWNLNVFTNQRHFALPLAITLFIIYFLVKNELIKKSLSVKLSIIFGIIIGTFSFLHGAVFIMSIVILLVLFILFPHQRKSIFIIGLVTLLTSLPRTIFLLHVESSQIFKFHPGYLLSNDLSFFKWIRYWVLNLGLTIILAPLGFIYSSKLAKKIFTAFSILFIIGNLFQFSPDIATNHKFFNLWLIVVNIYVAYALYRIWKKRIKVLVIVLLFFLIISGIIDLFPIINDPIYPVADYPKNMDVKWIMDNTPKNAVFLNSSYLYNPVNLAGRKIFLGWPYYPWSLGYNTLDRETLLKELYNSSDSNFVCRKIRENKIRYITFDNSPDPAIKVNREFFLKNFMTIYKNNENGFIIIDPTKKCNF